MECSCPKGNPASETRSFGHTQSIIPERLCKAGLEDGIHSCIRKLLIVGEINQPLT